MSSETLLERPDAWADLLAALAECLREPDEDLLEHVQDGELQDALADAVERLDLQPAPGIDPPSVSSVGVMTESYLALFEALETPYAPNAESPYKPWYGERTGLMAGPPAEEMRRRYAAIDADVPPCYPADHVSLLLEYGSLLLDAGAVDAFVVFQEDHFDWFPALRLATAGAAAESPFHRWAVFLLDDVATTLRSRLGSEPIDDETAASMVDRIGDVSPWTAVFQQEDRRQSS
ncbi:MULTISPECIES: molecular chaperone TorD family protein [Haloferax]|uniref:Dehydrogenase n=1 Tax=Haloferax marinum TaxID=2666143 RepID=A0A6A8GC93_9EURY|nr:MULTISPECIES: molecular chaperone TorD family protein [Haloferax]KAB1190773.1 dehydrogenase [Haloferax sp. CBA1150]MRW98312.1 dehydrogenase [Haloferax marinum]